MVNHDHERIIAKRGWEIGDQVNRQLLKWASATGGNGGKCRDSRVGIDLHLLAKGTTEDKAADEGGHTQPPIIPRQQGIGAKESPMAGSEGQVDRGNKVMAGVGRDVKTVFKVKARTRNVPISQRGAREQR